MNITWKVTKKKLKPFLDERGLELQETRKNYIFFYYLAVKGASVFSIEYHDKTHFYNLKSVLVYLLENPSFNSNTIVIDHSQ